MTQHPVIRDTDRNSNMFSNQVTVGKYVLRKLFTFLVLFSILLVICFVIREYFGFESQKMATVESPLRRSLPETCTQPPGGFKAWRSGVVTVLKPEISRNCSKLFRKDYREMARVKKANRIWKNELTDDEFLEKTEDCSWLRNELSDNLYNTVVEKNFPLAFVFVVSKSPQQVFRLIKLLYRPQNVFCIHYDLKSNDSFKNIFDNMARCINNVKIASEILAVTRGDYTLLGAQMNCFSDLVKMRPSLPVHQQWKYAMNLCGTELPVKTNHEIVMYLRSLKGSSNVRSREIPKNKRDYWDRIKDAGPLPNHLTFHKSYGYNALSFEYAYFLVENRFAIKVHDYFKNTQCPEEHFYATLFMYPWAPGGFRSELKSRYNGIMTAMWCFEKKGKTTYSCHGKIVHYICICASGDLSMIMLTAKRRSTFFHNKYDESLDHTVMDCLEERIVEKNQLEYQKECGN